MILIIVGIAVVSIYPLVFSIKFRINYGVFPISGIGLVLQVASLIGLIVDLADEASNNEVLMTILFGVCCIVASVLAVVKVSKAGGTTGQKISAVWSQFVFFIYIVYILWKILTRSNSDKHPPLNNY